MMEHDSYEYRHHYHHHRRHYDYYYSCWLVIHEEELKAPAIAICDTTSIVEDEDLRYTIPIYYDHCLYWEDDHRVMILLNRWSSKGERQVVGPPKLACGCNTLLLVVVVVVPGRWPTPHHHYYYYYYYYLYYYQITIATRRVI